MSLFSAQALLSIPPLILLPVVFFSSSAIWLIWKIVRPFVVQSELWNVRGPERTSWAAGNLQELYDPSNIKMHHDFIEKYGGVVRLHGPFGSEHLYVTDPLALHHVVVKEQDVYEEPPRQIALNNLSLGPGLLSTLGAHHAKQKRTLNPFFSIKHMREDLMPVFLGVSEELCTIITNKLNVRKASDSGMGKPEIELDMLTYMSRTALEYIAQGGMGYTFNSFGEGEDGEFGEAEQGGEYGKEKSGEEGKVGKDQRFKFAEAVKELIPTISTLQLPLQFLHLLMPFVNLLPVHPATRRHLVLKFLKFVPSRRVRKFVSILEIIEETSRGVLAWKRKEMRRALREGGEAEAGLYYLGEGEGVKGTRVMKKGGRDVLSVLLKAEMTQKEEDRIPEHEIIGHMNVLLFAAYDTTTSALCRALHLLAQHQDIQRRLRREIWDMVKKLESERRTVQELGYDELNDLREMRWLEAVVREMMRVHAPVTFAARNATRSTILPLSRPVLSKYSDPSTGKPKLLTHIPIPKGLTIQIGIGASNRDKKIWGEDADEFRVERFLHRDSGEVDDDETGVERPGKEGDKEKLPGIYGGMMTFMGGARSCIGFKFSQLEMKVVLFTLLNKFTFSTSPTQDPLVVWEMHNIQSPAVKGKGKGLPLVVRFAGEDDATI